MWCHVWVCPYISLVLSPDPAPKREKGLVYIECFLGLVSEFWCANQIRAMWLTWHCDYLVTPLYSQLWIIIAVRENSWIRCVAMPKWCVVTITWHATSCCTPQKHLVYTRHFPLWERGLGTRLTYRMQLLILNSKPKSTGKLTKWASSGFFEWDSDLFELVTILCIATAQNNIGLASVYLARPPAVPIVL